MSTKGSKTLRKETYEAAAVTVGTQKSNTRSKVAKSSQTGRIVIKSNQNTIVVKVEPSRIRRQDLMRKLNSKR